MRTELDKLCEGLLFDFGRAVLGNHNGAIINRMFRSMGIDGSRRLIKMAQGRSDPVAYVMAAMKDRRTEDSIPAGEVYKGWKWTGSTWRKLEESAP